MIASSSFTAPGAIRLAMGQALKSAAYTSGAVIADCPTPPKGAAPDAPVVRFQLSTPAHFRLETLEQFGAVGESGRRQAELRVVGFIRAASKSGADHLQQRTESFFVATLG
jgi:hypothetical protein